jgi:hypothetical protein
VRTLILAAVTPDNTPHGYNLTFAFPMLLFAISAVVLYLLFSRPHRRIPAQPVRFSGRPAVARGANGAASAAAGTGTVAGATATATAADAPDAPAPEAPVADAPVADAPVADAPVADTEASSEGTEDTE